MSDSYFSDLPANADDPASIAVTGTSSTAIVIFDTKAAVSAYDKFNVQIAEIEKLGDLTVAVDGIDKVEEGHKLSKRVKSGINSVHESLKRPCIDYGKTVDSIKNQLIAKIDAVEVKLKSERKKYDDAEAAVKKQREIERMAVIQNRINMCSQLSIAFDLIELQGMTDSDFDMWYETREKDAIALRARIEEEARLAKEFADNQQREHEELAAKMRADFEAEQKRKADELQARAEELEKQRKADEVIRQELEAEIVRKQAAQAEAMRIREVEIAIREKAAADAIEKQRQDHVAMVEKQNAERFAAEEVIRKEKEAAQKLVDEEQARVLAAQKAEADRIEADRKAEADRVAASQKVESDRLEAERKELQVHRDELDRKEAAERSRVEAEKAAVESKRRMELASSELEKLAGVISKKQIEDRLKELGFPWWGPELLIRMQAMMDRMKDFVTEGEEAG